MSDKIARLVERNQNERNGGTYEIWNIGHDVGFYVDFNPCPVDTGVPETMAFIMDLRNWKVLSWNEEGVWYEDATGGKAVRELGYKPVEDNDSDSGE